ncbi:winged helix-turn-helix domain-containing protein [Streptomyces sp. NPDC127106]|uniref:winged helix-turn-helix domain-containing protein n=1 Tax=Streptomyces sp. NPDC127106 TaxID=3345360 RepID=UPI00364394F0
MKTVIGRRFHRTYTIQGVRKLLVRNGWSCQVPTRRAKERRKVSRGTCARAYGTACIHEHACVRCSLLRPDPAQCGRLVEIRTTSSTGSPVPSAKAGTARPEGSASASPAPDPRSATSTRRQPTGRSCWGSPRRGLPGRGDQATGSVDGQTARRRRSRCDQHGQPGLEDRTGAVSFGLVSPPVALCTATDSHTIRFHQLQRGTADRIRNRRVNERTGDEVDLDDIAPGPS